MWNEQKKGGGKPVGHQEVGNRMFPSVKSLVLWVDLSKNRQTILALLTIICIHSLSNPQVFLSLSVPLVSLKHFFSVRGNYSLSKQFLYLPTEVESQPDEDPRFLHAALHLVRLPHLRGPAGRHLQAHRGLEHARVHLLCRHHPYHDRLWRLCRWWKR